MIYLYKILKNKELVDKRLTHSKKRFLKNLRTISWKDAPVKVYLRISYGKRVDNFGKLVAFYNDGIYENKKDLWLAFNAFTEEE